MSEVFHEPILCGICRTPIDERIIPNSDSQFGCAACDNWDSKDEVMRIAGEYAQAEAQLILNRTMADAAKGSKILKFSGKLAHDETYRFVVDLKL